MDLIIRYKLRRLRNSVRLIRVYFHYYIQYLFQSNLGGELRSASEFDYKVRFLIHKIEKGLAFESRKSAFGQDVVLEIIELLSRYSYRTEARQQCVTILSSYYNCVQAQGEFGDNLGAFLSKENVDTKKTDVGLEWFRSVDMSSFEGQGYFKEMLKSRVSVRDYSPIFSKEDYKGVVEALEICKRTPSVCNRQPWEILVVSQPKKIQKLLSFQNGNRGFGKVPVLLVVVSDLLAYCDDKEVFQPFFDCGMLSMNVLLSLHAHGFVACPLNLCTSVADQRSIVSCLGLSNNFRATLMISIGRPLERSAVKGCISPVKKWIVKIDIGLEDECIY